MARGRGIIDFVSSLTDAQTIAFGTRLGGATGLLWSSSPRHAADRSRRRSE